MSEDHPTIEDYLDSIIALAEELRSHTDLDGLDNFTIWLVKDDLAFADESLCDALDSIRTARAAQE